MFGNKLLSQMLHRQAVRHFVHGNTLRQEDRVVFPSERRKLIIRSRILSELQLRMKQEQSGAGGACESVEFSTL